MKVLLKNNWFAPGSVRYRANVSGPAYDMPDDWRDKLPSTAIVEDEPVKDEPVEDEGEPVEDEPAKDEPVDGEPVEDEPVKDEGEPVEDAQAKLRELINVDGGEDSMTSALAKQSAAAQKPAPKRAPAKRSTSKKR